jgi:hypothetical protein
MENPSVQVRRIRELQAAFADQHAQRMLGVSRTMPQRFARLSVGDNQTVRNWRRGMGFNFLHILTGLLDKPPYDRLPDAGDQTGMMRYYSPIPQSHWRQSDRAAHRRYFIQAITTRATIEVLTDADADS